MRKFTFLFLFSTISASACIPQRSLAKRDAPLGSTSLINLNTVDPTAVLNLLKPLMDASELNQALLPVSAKLLMAPFGAFSEVVSRALMLMMVSAYTAADVIPSAINRIQKMDSPLVARLVDPSVSEEISPIVKELSNVGQLRTFMDSILTHLKLDSVPCKAILARKSGHLVQESFPTMGGYISSAIYPWAEDGYVQLMLDSMADSTSTEAYECPALENMVKYWQELRTQNVSDVIRDALRNAVAHALSKISPLVEPATDNGLKGTAYETASLELQKDLKVRALQLALKAVHAAL